MNYGELIPLGFTPNEARIYLEIIKKGKTDARSIIKELGFHKTIIYDNIEKLIEKGLISYMTENNRKVFILEPAQQLIELVNQEAQELKNKEDQAKKIAKKIEQTQQEKPIEQDAHTYRGTQGVRQIFNLIEQEATAFISLGAPQVSADIMGETFWSNFHRKQEAKKIKAKLLFNQDLEEYTKQTPNIPSQVRITNQLNTKTQTLVWNDKTAIITWTTKPIIVLIKDEELAKSYKQQFEVLWNQAQEK